MSGFSSIARPGSVPTHSVGGGRIDPAKLFGSKDEREEYRRALDGFVSSGQQSAIKIKKVKVEIFDLSNDKDVEAYEKLWAELLEKSSKMEVVVDARKDLVHRADGTSDWLKYVEYVEFCGSEDDSGKEGAENE